MRWNASITLLLGLFLVPLLGAAVATAGNYVEPSDVDISASMGEAPNVSRLRNMWFAGQPAAADFEVAKKEGITTVINLRPPSEMTWDEQATVKQLGMTYYNLPVEGDEPFSMGIFNMIDVLVADKSGEQILIHCSTSNRVGAWLATHLVREKGMTIDSSIVVGRRAGMKKKPLEAKVREFLANPAP